MYEITYKYSDLDKEHQFGIEQIRNAPIYNAWVWFYLGELFAGSKPQIYPYKLMAHGFEKVKILKAYQFANNAKKQAQLIHGCIIRKLNEINTKTT
jgi:hypothetical protein